MQGLTLRAFRIMYTPNSLPASPLNEHDESEEVYGVGRFLWEIAKVLLLAFAIIVPIRVFLFQPFFVQGASMKPSFQDGEYLIIGELGYKKTDVGLGGARLFSVDPSRELHRQEVAVFRPPLLGNSGQFFIKRIIGLPGETVELRAGKVIIHNAVHPEGFVLDESAYLHPSLQTLVVGSSAPHSVTLGNDEYFVMGDNRMESHDSRAFGPVNKDLVIGKVLLRAWPVDRAQVY